jgi:phosphoribosylanthranilate isomerase
MIVRTKICCIGSPEEARVAVACGASALGAVSAMPSGPGVIDESTIADVAGAVPPGVPVFLLTSLREPDAIVAQARRCGVHVVQLCDWVPPAGYDLMRAAFPGLKIVQVIHVTDERSIAQAKKAARHADVLLLDSGRPDGPVKELGGTGRVHDWSLSRVIREETGVPVWLAGGLTPANVRDAIQEVRPFGVDVCNGVRTGGGLDPAKVREFLAAVMAAGNDLGS